MANTKSAKKAIRSSSRKRQYNAEWKKKIKAASKSLSTKLSAKTGDSEALNKEFVLLQKLLDKASNKKVLHINRVNRLKSKYAQKISGFVKKTEGKAVKATSQKSK